MKTKLCYIYWSLLFISIISSGVLFIIVAAEHGVSLGAELANEKKEAQKEALNPTAGENKLSDQKPNFDATHFDTLKEEETRQVEEIRSSFEEVPSEVAAVSRKEQQPNSETGTLFHHHASISDELSETGHAVVFTLVDSASQELQQAAAASSLLTSVDAENDTAPAIVSGPVTILLPLKSDATSNESAAAYIVRAEPKQIDTPSSSSSSPTPSTATERSQDATVSADAEGAHPAAEDGVVYAEDVLHIESSNDSVVTTAEQPSAHQEDIPSFSEWAQKQLAEAEKKKVENKTGGVVKGRAMKLMKKNYASPDCGAKVVGTNPEASSVWAVLSPSRDEYLLNSCNNKIYFIVELCEAIQPKKIELANFELFSSILREFSVSVSDRHPSRDWTQIGQFEGKEVRTVQTFNVEPPGAFVKYIRVEFHSHYGTEHYCPISLFRVYGTSEFEVLDTVDEAQSTSGSLEDDEDEFDEGESLEKPRNLFSSARDAVLSIVKRAAEVLAKREDGMDGSLLVYGTNMTYGIGYVPCVTPAYIIVCDNCTDHHFNSVHQLLSCHGKELEAVLESEFVRNAVSNSDTCVSRGLDLRNNAANNGAPYPLRPRTTPALRNEQSRYLETMFTAKATTALCNLLAITQRRVVLNITYDTGHDANETVSVGSTDIPILLEPAPSTCSLDSTVPSSVPYEVPSSASQSGSDSSNSPNPQIKPTKTLTAEDQHSVAAAVGQPNSQMNITDDNPQNDTAIENTSTVAASQPSTKTPSEDQPATAAESATVMNEEGVLEFPEEVAATVGDTLTFDSIFSELDEVESDPSSQPATLSPPQVVQRESVFLRLAKRIKALERNMSLSGQYLEELSRRYKRQVEEMQRTLAEVIEERRRVEEKEERRGQQVAQLSDRVAALSLALETLMEERDSWAIKHGAVILVEVVVFALIMFLCRWLPDVEVTRHRFSMGWPRPHGLHHGTATASSSIAARRRSIDGSMSQPSQRSRKRRPSEEALRISGSTHQELMIPDASRKNSRAENRRRRRKKKDHTVTGADDAAATGVERQYVEVVPVTDRNGGDVEEKERYAMPPPPPPPPLPPSAPAVASAPPAVTAGGYIVMPVNGSSKTLTLAPGPPNYIQTALSFRKKRTGSRQSSSDSTGILDSSSTSSIKKVGPFKKIMRKFF